MRQVRRFVDGFARLAAFSCVVTLVAACGESENGGGGNAAGGQAGSNSGGTAGNETGGASGDGGTSTGGKATGGKSGTGGKGTGGEDATGGTGGGGPTTCDPDPCTYGTCVSDSEGVSCECDLGWGGLLCNEPIEVEDHCEPNPCEHGVCENQNDGYDCECELGWGGAKCDDEIPIVDHCESEPCEHGVCINKSESYECSCDLGWSGKDCDVEKDPCDPSPCQNGGSCSPSLDGAVCECLAGFTGPKCNQVVEDACTPNPCMNGTCESTLAGAVCDCDAGWSGTHCDVETPDPCTPNPCENGSCEADGAQAACDCFTGWTGATCDTAIPDVPSNPVLQLENCSLELVSSSGWTDVGNGIFTAAGSAGLNLGGGLLAFAGSAITYDSNTKSFSGAISSLPFPAMDFLSGSGLSFPSAQLASTSIMTGAQIKTALGNPSTPLPDDIELLAFQVTTPHPKLAINGTGDGLTVKMDDDVHIGFYLDPCDPLSYLHLSDKVMPALGPVQLQSFGSSVEKRLAQESQVELWNGDTVQKYTMSGHAYLSGALSLEAIAKIPLDLNGSMLVDVDPNRDGSLDPGAFGTFFTTGDIIGAVEGLTANASDFALLGNGQVTPSLPLVVAEVAAFFQDAVGLRLDLANGSIFYDNGSLYFRGIMDANPFQDTPIADFVPHNPESDLMGYAKSPTDWGISFESDAHFIPGGPGYASTFNLLMSDTAPTLTIDTQIDFGTIDFIPGITIPLGSVPISFGVDFATGDVCGETGYTSSEFTCTIEVCVGPSSFEFNPTCELPSGFLCVDDSMCISDSCSNLIPESGCSAACDGVQLTCKGACEATGAACDGTCTATEATCKGACTAAAATCGAGCVATDATCNGACTATGETCRGVCNGTEGACNAGCTAAQGTCNGACDAAATACQGGCYAGTGACTAAKGTCDVGCDAACWCWRDCLPWPADSVCWDVCTCDNGACHNDCTNTYNSCVNAIVSPCFDGCNNTRNSCKSGCNSGLSNCGNTCKATGDSCRGPCNSVESGCHSACAANTANCNAECADVQADCNGPCESAAGDCHGGCDSAFDNCAAPCDSARDGCVAGCELVGTCD
jgi:hypothetical protein